MRYWYDKYTTPEWEKKFRKYACKIFSNHSGMEEDAFQAGWERLLIKLPQEEWEKLLIKSPKLKASDEFDAYVMTTFKHMITDEYRHHFGRCEPNVWVKKLGGFWTQIAKMLCQTAAPAEEIADKIPAALSDQIEERTHTEYVRSIVSRLHAKPYCSTLGSREIQGSEDVDYGKTDSTEQSLSERELIYLLQIILDEDSIVHTDTAVSAHIIQHRKALSDQLNLSLDDSDWILLRSIFSEGKKVPFIAKALNKTDTQIRYQLKKILSIMQAVLTQFDIDLSLLDD